MEKMIIHIPEDTVTYIEGLQYDLGGLRDLIARISEIKKENNEELDSFWLQNYLDKNLEYNYAKQELEKEYIKPLLVDISNYKWRLNFDSCEVIVEYEKI